MPRTKIYFDMDGVLVNMFHGIGGLVGMSYAETAKIVDSRGWIQSATLPPPFKDLTGAQIHLLLAGKGKTFWRRLPVHHEGVRFMREIHRLGFQVSILTRPTPEPSDNCKAGKLAWVADHLADIAPKVIFTDNKAKYAGPRTFLIDDEPGNVDAFLAAGGNAFLWPQPWHRPLVEGQQAALCRASLRKAGVL